MSLTFQCAREAKRIKSALAPASPNAHSESVRCVPIPVYTDEQGNETDDSSIVDYRSQEVCEEDEPAREVELTHADEAPRAQPAKAAGRSFGRSRNKF